MINEIEELQEQVGELKEAEERGAQLDEVIDELYSERSELVDQTNYYKAQFEEALITNQQYFEKIKEKEETIQV